MEGYCSIGQSPQRAVVPMEDEEEEYLMESGVRGIKQNFVVMVFVGIVN
jgi:hypothetical protein